MFEFSLNANSVALVAQGSLTATIWLMLRNGARTPARRTLGRAQAWLTAYAVGIFVTFSAIDPLVGAFGSLMGLTFAVVAAFELLAYALWQRRGARPSEPTTTHRAVAPTVIAVVVTIAVAGLVSSWMGRVGSARLASISINLILLGIFVAMFGALRSAASRGIASAKSMARACAWPVIAIVGNIVASTLLAVGVSPPIELYNVVRDVSILLFAFGLLVSYLDHGHEPMSLHARLVAGTLTIVAALVTTAGHVLEPFVTTASASPLAAAHGLALRLLMLLFVCGALVYALLPRLFRRSMLEPLDALVGAIAVVERGETAELPALREDELGRLSRSFNKMSRGLVEGRRALENQVDELERRQKEVEALNDELRHQIAARSKNIAESLQHALPKTLSMSTGMTIGGRYRIERQLGQGAMGVVYEATRTSDARKLALKMLTANASTEDALRLAREAEIASGLSHPNLVSVVDVGMQDGQVFLVMDLVEGGALDASRQRFGDLAFALPVLRQIAHGLVALHDAGVVHRDLKPANVLLEESGGLVVKIADFGIARMDGIDALGATVNVDAPTARVASLTQTGIMMGTLAYMAPELATSSAVRPASDIFAFGVLAFEVLSGKYPFRLAPMLAILGQASISAPLDLPDLVPPRVREIVRRTLALEPEHRPTAREIVDALS